MSDVFMRAASIRQKLFVRETLEEFSRIGNYIRIYPAKGSESFDQYFNGGRVFNKLLHKVLYTNDVLKYASG